MHFSIRFNRSSTTSHDLVKIDCPGNLYRDESDANFRRILFGKVYEDKVNLAELASRCHQGDPNVRGRYLLVEISLTNSQVKIWTDKYRLLNCMLILQRDFLWIGNAFEKIPQDIDFHVDPIAIASMKEFGVVLYPRTLFNELKMLEGHATWDRDRNCIEVIPLSTQWPLESQSGSAAGIIQKFREGLLDIFHHWKPARIRLSGGVDTRFFAFLSPLEKLQSLKAEVVCHPKLTPETDRDVLGAELIAEELNLNLEVLTVKAEDYNYLPVRGATSEFTCSGLYGGEFLGGLLYLFAPWKDHLKEESFNKSESPDRARAHEEWGARLRLLGPRRLTTELYLSAFRSTIYRSVERSWSDPQRLNTLILSPYVESVFLDELLSIHFSGVENYKIFAASYRTAAGERRDLPLASPLVEMQAGFFAFSQGLDPKRVDRSHLNLKLSNVELADLNLKNFFNVWNSRFRSNHPKETSLPGC